MNQAINAVFKFVNETPGYRASLGVVTSVVHAETQLVWGAVNPETDDVWVPELAELQRLWPDAKWTPMTQQQASLFDAAYQRELAPRQDWLLSL